MDGPTLEDLEKRVKAILAEEIAKVKLDEVTSVKRVVQRVDALESYIVDGLKEDSGTVDFSFLMELTPHSKLSVAKLSLLKAKKGRY